MQKYLYKPRIRTERYRTRLYLTALTHISGYSEEEYTANRCLNNTVSYNLYILFLLRQVFL